ncbi:MAG: bifunctional diaminohydroxyphosphoribosylaminopyrimidine deaminase/5-amino-6-(5-phosphoribosylamino)uracil reductase RibD [Planctomycetota bacterium]|nr:MAG: bifunctional diaminohydroxyphosphoribosylaminopyrimidine deaminase/5-amino-6-(5-phosphoribosylamino)uracil reductase RibD [Planctomycetota bacterium]
MKRALTLAARGRGHVEPNPMVGCLIVRGKKIIGRGYHRKFGGPHAEINALRAAGARARGATVYVTLEPCCHHGKTPPCTDALIAAGVKRVVASMPDPFAEVRNKGLRQLRSAGIEVAIGCCKTEAATLNGPYLKLQNTLLPWVILNWAQSLDGKIATRKGDSKWISSPESRKYAHRIRGRVDAVIVGVGTVIADDPMLNCRLSRPRRVAARIVIDPELRTPISAKVVQSADKIPSIIATDRRLIASRKIAGYQRAGIEIIGLPYTRAGLALRQLLKKIGRRGMTNIMVEGGGKTLGSFFDAGLADEAIIFVSRRLIGGNLASSPLAGKGPAKISEVISPLETKVTRCGNDDVYHLRLRDPLDDLP